MLVRALIGTTPGSRRCASLRRFSSATASSSASHTDTNTNAFAGLSRKELKAYHALVRSAQVSDALQRGYQEGVCGKDSTELEELLRATRTRPSLLTPLANAVGIVLRYLPIPPSTGFGDVKEGLISSLEESFDANVRHLIEMERAENAKAPAVTAVKEFMKAKRDGLGEEEDRAGPGGNSGVLTQATQIISRTIIRAAARF